MWICPKCTAKNQDSSRLCCICGTAPDGSKYESLVPLPYTDDLPTAPKESRMSKIPKPVGVPRRFSVGTLMIMIAFFGVLFAIMKMLNTNTIAFCCIAAFLAGIGAAQMTLFGGKEPRKASWVAGIPLGFVCGLVGMIIFSSSYRPSSVVTGLTLGNPVREPPTVYDALVAATSCALIGGPCGYLAGCLIAGIFLVRERESDQVAESQGTFDDDREQHEANNQSLSGKAEAPKLPENRQ